jgi:prolycopene isomerase
LINAGMVLCDRFYGGINYPRGGVGGIPRLLAEGLQVELSLLQASIRASADSFNSHK